MELTSIRHISVTSVPTGESAMNDRTIMYCKSSASVQYDFKANCNLLIPSC